MKSREPQVRRAPVLTEELGSVLIVEDSCLEDPAGRAAVAAARKGPPVVRGQVSRDPHTGKYNLTLDIAGPIRVFEDSNTLELPKKSVRPLKPLRPSKAKRRAKAKKA